MELDIQKNVPLHKYTTLHVGGVADYFALVSSAKELREALQFAKQNAVPLFILGGGSNVLISDDGFPGLIILINIKGREYHDRDKTNLELRLGAGEIFDDVIKEVTEKNLWGLENLSSIPGTVGATPVQNVGAYGVEVSALIISVEAINIETLEEKKFSNDECQFLYRDSFFKTTAGKQWVITFVTVSLTKEPSPRLEYSDLLSLKSAPALTPSYVRKTIEGIRSQKFPNWLLVGTAGSFFKNPIITKSQFDDLKQVYKEIPGYLQEDGRIKVSLGYVLDKICALKGYCEGNVCLYEKQALVLVSTKNATATEIKNFSETIKKKVFIKTKIKIECEVLIL